MGIKDALEYQSSLINKINGVNSTFAKLESIANKVNGNFNALSNAAKIIAGFPSLGTTLGQINQKLLPISPEAFKTMGASSQYLKLVSGQIPNFPKLVFPNYSEIFKNCNSFGLTEKYCSIVDKSIEIFSNYDYPLPLRLEIREMRTFLIKLKDIPKDIKESDFIDKFIIKTMSKNNWEYVEDIILRLDKNPKIQKGRIQILLDCLKVIKRFGKKTASNVVLPTLIAQLDGCWLDIIGGDDKVKRQRLKNLINDDYGKGAYEILAEVLFEQKTHKGAKNHNFCRNKILHGDSLEYGTIQNVLRVFLMFEFLNDTKELSELKSA